MSTTLRDFIKASEQLRLTRYTDAAGVATIGWGHSASGGRSLPERATVEQCEQWLTEDIEEAARAVARLVEVKLTQGQAEALTSFVFNLGAGAFAKSSLLLHLNKGDYATAATWFSKYIYAGGNVMKGLITRRAAELRRFEGGDFFAKKAPETVPEPVSPGDQVIKALTDCIPNVSRILVDETKSVPERNVDIALELLTAARRAVGAANRQELAEKAPVLVKAFVVGALAGLTVGSILHSGIKQVRETK